MVELTLLQKAANTYFGEDKVDIIGNITLIRFPEFNIVDLSTNRTHLIKDLYVQLLEYRKNELNSIVGFRGTFSDLEWHSNYAHSHLSRFNRDNPLSRDYTFCLGSSDLNTLVSTSRSGTFEESDWILFMLTLENYVQCESDAPYIHFRNLGNATNDNNYSERVIVDAIKKYTKENYYLPPVELTGQYGRPVNVVIEDSFLRDLSRYLPNEYLGTFDENLGYAVRTKTAPNFSGNTRFKLRFKGEDRIVTVYPTERNEKENILDFPTLTVQKAITNLINRQVNERYANYSARRDNYTRVSITDSHISNIFSPQGN